MSCNLPGSTEHDPLHPACLHPAKPRPKRLRRRHAFALVTVLMVIALGLVMFLAMMTSVTTDQATVHLDAESARTKILADSTIGIALSQLRTATEQTTSTGVPKPWTSQPGALRVHAQNGELETLYKLYSATSLTAKSFASLSADLPPSTWQTQPQHFVDLNAPVQTAAGLQFPILDPRAMSNVGGQPVEGFGYDAATAPAGVVPAPGPTKSVDLMRLPMPVRWLYVLQDGTLGTLGPNNIFIGPLPDKVPTEQNPIVARVAFWTDDESSKVNINTAAEGAFWDTPRADTNQERCLATMQPTRLEYQRHPGHPAGVCLSSVLLPGQRFHPAGFTSAMPAMELKDAQDLWSIGRLIVAERKDGTSKGGRMIPEQLASQFQPQPRPRQARYGSVNDIAFDTAKPDVTGLPTAEKAAATNRPLHHLFKEHPAALQRLAYTSGFLTTVSSSPETTLFGTPRIAMWPIHASTPTPGEKRSDSEPVTRYTRYDQIALLASTLGSRRYLVQRSEPGNGAMDLEVHAEGQNLRLLNYLSALTNNPFPGFAKSSQATFAVKYGTDADTGDRDAILLSMLDYVRATNFADGQLPADTQFSVLCPGEAHYGFGQVAPMQPRFTGTASVERDHYKALGRMLTVSEVSLIMLCRAEKDTGNKIIGQVSSTNRANLKNPGDREIEVGLLVESFLPEQGWTDYRPYASIALVGGPPGKIANASNSWPALSVNGVPLTPVTTTSTLEALATPPVGWRGWGGMTGVRGLTKGVIMFRPIVVPVSQGTEPPMLTFSGGSSDPMELKLAIYDTPSGAASGSASATDLMQVIPLKFADILPNVAEPETLIPLPHLPAEVGMAYPLANRVSNAVQGQRLISTEDIVQSLLPVHGDYRLIAARRWVESRVNGSGRPLFATHPRWGRQRQAHALRDPTCITTTAQTAGATTEMGLSYQGQPLPAAVAPDFPQSLGQPMSLWSNQGWISLSPNAASDHLRLDNLQRGPAWPDVTGDFDNGVGNCPDGPYTNRPDDGNWAANKSGLVPYFSPDTTSQVGLTVPPVTAASFSAQRLLPSPVMFGSLPTGIRAQVPWQTLLFRPQSGHYGAVNPPDHLLLDLFWAPVVEPEPVSLPFETQGKINLNHELVPFRYIQRSTALHAAMKAEALTAIPNSAADTYKSGGAPDKTFRKYIDATGTLSLWKTQVFDQGKVFLTASQVCEQPLVPEGVNADAASITAFWEQHRLTGDNSRELPYAHLYSRLTTRSNAYRVHYVVETLKKSRTGKATVFNPTKDRVTARHQGSCLLIRRLNFKRTDLPDYLANPQATSLDQFYEWRIEGQTSVR